MKKLLPTISLVFCLALGLQAAEDSATSGLFTIDTTTSSVGSGNLSGFFTIDTRDQENFPEWSNFITVDTTAPRVLNSPFVALGDMDGDGAHTLEDLVILSQYVAGQGSPSMDDFVTGNLVNDEELNTADVLALRDLVTGSKALSDVSAENSAFAISQIVGARVISGSLLEIWLSGDSADFVQYIQFGAISTPVIGWPDDHRVITRVPNVPAGITNLVAYGRGWVTDPYAVNVESPAPTSQPDGAVAAEFFTRLDGLLEYLRTDALAEMQTVGLINAGLESTNFELEVGRLEALVGYASTLLAVMPAEELALVDALLVANGFPQLVEDIAPPAEEDVSDFDLFYFLAAMDELSARLGRSHQSIAAMAAYLVEKTEMKGNGLTSNDQPIMLAAIVLSGLQIFIDHTLPTDLTRVRAQFVDGVNQIDDSADKEVQFIGDLRNERPDRRPTLGQALSGALVHFAGASNMQRALLEDQLALTSTQGLDELDASMLGEFGDGRTSAWAYNVLLPIAFHGVGQVDPDELLLWPIEPPVSIPFFLRYSSIPEVVDGAGDPSDLAEFDVTSGLLSAGSTLGSVDLRFSGFNWHAIGLGLTADSFVGYQRPLLLGDARIPATIWADFNPPVGAPTDEEAVLPLSFSVVNSAVTGSETPVTASVALTNGSVGAGVSAIQALLDAAPTMEIAIPALPESIAVNDVIIIPVYVRDTANALAAYDLLLYYNEAVTELLDIAPAPGQVFGGDYFFVQAQNAPGSQRIAGWTPNPVMAGSFVHAFTLSIRVLDATSGHQIAFRARRALNSANADLYAAENFLTLDAGAQIGGLPDWRWSFTDWAHGLGVPDDPEWTDPRYGSEQILAYALGWDPFDSRTWHTQSVMGDGANFTVEFIRRTNLPDEMVELETSENLTQWTIYTAQEPATAPTGDPDFELVTYTIPVNPEDLALFFRLFVQNL